MTPEQILEQEKQRQASAPTPADILAVEKGRMAGDANGSFYVSRDVQPDRASKVISLAERMGAQPDFVDQNLETIEEGEATAKRSSLLSELPRLANYFADPYRAAEASDSVPNFAEIERVFIERRKAQKPKGWTGDPLGQVVDLQRSVLSGALSLGSMSVRGIGEGARAINWVDVLASLVGIQYEGEGSEAKDPLTGMTDAALGLEQEKPRAPVSEGQFGIGIPGADYVIDAGNFLNEGVEYVRPDEQGFEDRVAEAVGQIAGAVGLTFATRSSVPAQIAFAGMGADQQAQAMRALGIDPRERPDDLGRGALVTGGSEALRLGSVLRVLPKNARDRAVKSIFARIAGQAGEEATQETIEGIGQNLITMGYDAEATVLDGLADQALTAGTASAIFQALVETALPGKQRGQRAEQAAQELTDIRTLIEETPVFQRSRQAVENFLNEAGEGETILLHGDDLIELYQSDPQVFEQRMEEIGLSEEDIQRAAQGMDVEVEAAKILSVSEGFEDLVQRVRIDDDTPSLRSIEREVEESDAMGAVDFQEAFERIQEQDQALEGFERVQSTVTEQLLGAGRGQAEAEAAGAVWGAMFRQLSEAGVDEGAVFERLGLRINESVQSDGVVMEQAAEAGYEGTNRGEAAEWLSAQAKGLDMSQEARIARAREMGFDTETVLYHGTAREFDSFDPEAPAQTKSSEEGSPGEAVFLTDSSNTAEAYARRSGFRHGSEPVGARSAAYEKTFAAERAIFPWTRRQREAASIEAWRNLTTERELDGGAKLVPVHVRLANPLVVRDFDQFSHERMNQILTDARQNGHDGVLVENFFDEWGEETQNYTIVFDPSNIRSVNAAFDPDYSDSANLLAQAFYAKPEPRFREGLRPTDVNDNREVTYSTFSDERLNQRQNKYVEMARNGFSNKEIAEEFETTADSVKSTLHAIKRKHGIEVPPARLGRQPTERQAIYRLIEKGLTNKQIAERLGKSINNVEVVRSQLTKAQREGRVLFQNPPRSLRAAMNMDPQQRAEWYDRVIDEQRKDASGRPQTLEIKPDTRNLIHDDVTIVFSGPVVEFTAKGIHFRTGRDRASMEDVRVAARVMSQVSAVLQEYMLRYDIPFIEFSGATPEHAKLYRSMLEKFQLDGYQAYEATAYSANIVQTGAEKRAVDGFSENDPQAYAQKQDFVIVKDGYEQAASSFTSADFSGELSIRTNRVGVDDSTYIGKGQTVTTPLGMDNRRGSGPRSGGDGAAGDGSVQRQLTPIEPDQRELFQSKPMFNLTQPMELNERVSLRNVLAASDALDLGANDAALGQQVAEQREDLLSSEFTERLFRAIPEFEPFRYRRSVELLASGKANPDMSQHFRQTLFALDKSDHVNRIALLQERRASVLIPGKGVLSEQDVLVRLTEASDRTSFLHESAHIFLELYAALESENEVIAERMAAIRKWLKIKPGEQITRDQHEKFAESFEAYLMEGVAPSAELRSVFQQFRNWFIDVYRRLRGQLRNLDPEARDIFDRMLASDVEIEMAQGQYVGTLSKAMEGLMDAEQVEKYQKHARKAGNVARDKLFKKHMAQVRARERKAYKEERGRVEDMARAQLGTWPEYRALAEFREGGRSLNAAQVDRETKLNTSERGEHPEIVAPEMGFTSADEMLKAVEKAPPFERVVKQTTDKIMRDRYGDMMEDGSIEAEAMEAVFNEPSIRMMEAERNALAAKASGQPIPLAAIRKRADQIINETPIDKVIKPGRYAIKARDLHKRALRAAAKGKWDEALRVTHQAMLMHELARRAFKARDEVQKINRFLARFAPHRKLDPKKIAADYIAQIRVLMSLPGAQEQTEARSGLNAFADAQANDGYGVVLPADVVTGRDLPIRRRMTMDQLRAFRDGVKSLNTLGRQQSAEAQEAFNAEAQAIADEIDANWKGPRKRETRNPTRKERAAAVARTIDAEIIRWPFLIEALQGGKTGIIIESMETRLRQALTDRNARRQMMADKLAAILKKHGIKQSELNKTVSAPVIEAGSVKFEQVMAVALNMGTEQNRDRLVSDPSMNGDLAAIEQTLADHLEKRHWDAVQEVWDLINTLWPDASAVERRATGVTPKKVDASSVQTKYGAYRGGYYPLKYDRDFLGNKDLEQQDKIDEWKNGVNGMATRASTQQGFLKERQQNVERPLRLSMDVILSHIDDVTNDIYMREPAGYASRLLQKRRVQKAITETHGREYLRTLETILKRVVTGTEKADTLFEKVTKGFRINASVAILGHNVVTAGLAPISYFQTVIPQYGFKTVFSGIAEYYSNPFKNAKLIKEKSAFMRERQDTLTREAHELIRKSAGQSLWGKAQGLGYWLMATVEKHSVSGALWVGVYNQSLAEGDSEADAITKADRSIATTQGSGLELDQSVLQGGNESVRLLTFMWGYISGYYGTVRNDVARQQGIRKLMPLLKHMVILNLLASALEAIIRGGFGDEEDPYIVSVMQMLGRNVFGLVPGVSNFVSKYDSGPAVFQVGASGTRAMEAWYKAGVQTYEDGEAEGETMRRAMIESGKFGGFLFGVPGTIQAMKIEKTLAEDDDPTFYEAIVTGPDEDN